MTKQEPWTEVAARKRKSRDDRINPDWRISPADYKDKRSLIDVPETCGILNQTEIEITSKYDAVDILEKIRDRVFSVEQVVTAFCKRAAIAQQLTNCLTEIFFDEAIATARALDKDRAENPEKVLPPLFGLPISLKDSFNIPGFDATIGFISLAEKPCTEYSALPRLLKNLGAVFYCKTNVPQTMMTADSDNNVFGRTLNPCNTHLTAGGSTGGEGALIALRGSVIGIGTDVAGSIRIPSLSNGIYGFKPSADIVPFTGQQDPVAPGMPGIAPSAGPMATSIRSCTFLLKTIYEAEPWKYDASCLHIPWTGAPLAKRPLRIGVAADDGLHTPSPPVRRGLDETVEKLRNAGVEIVPVTIPNVADSLNTTWAMYSLDGAKTMLSFIESSGEPLVPSVAMTGLVATPGKTLEEYVQLNYARQKSRKDFANLWSENQLDALLLPPAPHTTVPLDTWRCITYTAIFNLLDCPSCVIPVGSVTSDDAADAITNAKYGPWDEGVYKLYTGPDEYIGAPIAVQLVGQSQEDEKLSSVATILDNILRTSQNGHKSAKQNL